jgi:hypothetical protein
VKKVTCDNVTGVLLVCIHPPEPIPDCGFLRNEGELPNYSRHGTHISRAFPQHYPALSSIIQHYLALSSIFSAFPSMDRLRRTSTTRTDQQCGDCGYGRTKIQGGIEQLVGTFRGKCRRNAGETQAKCRQNACEMHAATRNE